LQRKDKIIVVYNEWLDDWGSYDVVHEIEVENLRYATLVKAISKEGVLPFEIEKATIYIVEEEIDGYDLIEGSGLVLDETDYKFKEKVK